MQAILREKDLTLDQLRKQVDGLKAELAASELAR
jgi:chromosome segregation ATPase